MSYIVNTILNFAVHLINILGYPGVLVAGSLEFLGLPISSEVLIPIVGLMCARGSFNFFLAYLFLTVGSVIGTLIMFSVGYFASNWAARFIRKKFSNSTEKIDNLSTWMRKNGASVVFLARFIPFARVYVSLLAGIEKFNPMSFLLFTTLGVGVWNLAFMLIGFYLGDNLNLILNLIEVHKYVSTFILLGIVLILIGIFLFIRKRKKRNK